MKAHAFAAAAFLGATLVSQPVAGATAEPQRPRAQMRFRAMDTNNDGRITRAEWRGNDRSFRNHDWNKDGMLSGDEIRVGAVPPRNNQIENGFYEWTRAGFRSVDANRDNRITRNEWNYDYELFLRADRNRDNVLTLAEFLGSESVDLDREDRFTDLDTNNNGLIERREWHGTRDAFVWLDRDNDGPARGEVEEDHRRAAAVRQRARLVFRAHAVTSPPVAETADGPADGAADGVPR